MTSDPWTPILTEKLSERAKDAVEGILMDLAQPDLRRSQNRWTDPFIGLCFAEVAQDTGAVGHAQEAAERLDAAIDALAQHPIGPGLFGGFCGVAWLAVCMPLILKRVSDQSETLHTAEPTNDPCREIDEILVRSLSARPWQGSYDLISGLVGIGVYARERLRYGRGSDIFRLVIEQLDSMAIETPTGITWWTPPQFLPEYQRASAPQGYYNLGMAHGVPGIVALLGHACRAGIAVAEASRLLEGAVDWILAEQLPEGPGARYAAWSTPGITQNPTRMAWCYGGLGISAALMVAARSLNSERWERLAHNLALSEASRPVRDSGVVDACLCHGSAGNGHVFARFFHATADPRFLQSARFWYEHTLALRKSGRGIGGYQFYIQAPLKGGTASEWGDETSFASGAAGVALALQAAIGHKTPLWDRLLLIDIPSSGRGDVPPAVEIRRRLG